MIQIDTDVLVECARLNLDAWQRLDQLSIWRFSAVAWMELIQGCQSKKELLRIQEMMRGQPVERLPVTPSISDRAIELLMIHASISGLRFGDALIAATAIEHDHTLLTANMKHFRQIEGLRIEKFEMRSQPSGPSVHEARSSYGLVELEG